MHRGADRQPGGIKAEGVLIDADPEALARLINGASTDAAAWIAGSDDPEATSKKAVAGFRQLLNGLVRKASQAG